MDYVIPRLEKMANVTGIAAGVKRTIAIPARGVIHAILLMCRTAAGVGLTAAQIAADVGDIACYIGGDMKILATAAQLDMLFKYWNSKNTAFTTAGLIPIMLNRPHFPNAKERLLLGWGMADVESFTMDINILGVAQLSTMEVWVLYEDSQRNLGRHICINRSGQSFAATGVQEITNLPVNQADRGLIALHIDEPTAIVTSATYKVGIKSPSRTDELYKEVPFEVNNHWLRNSGRVAQTGIYHIDLAQVNDPYGFLPLGNISSSLLQLTWQVAAGAPGNFDILSEEVRGLDKPVA